ncbi:MAG: hypothetical protein ACFFCQ_03310 [Promethearchaeota archaeon]
MIKLNQTTLHTWKLPLSKQLPGLLVNLQSTKENTSYLGRLFCLKTQKKVCLDVPAVLAGFVAS